MSKNLTEQQIVDILKQGKAVAGKEWERSTYHKLETLIQSDVTIDSKLRTQWSNLLFNFTAVTKKRALLFGVLGILSIGVVGLLGYNVLRNRPLSAEQQREILTKIIASNANAAIRSPQTAALETTTLSTRNAGGAELADDAQVLPLYPPVASDHNYIYSKNTYTSGPAAGKCLAFGAASQNNQYESYSFTDMENAKFYYKSQSLDSEGQMTSYSLSKNDGSTNEYYEYLGGEFALKTFYNNASLERTLMDESGSTGSAPSDSDISGPEGVPVETVPGPDMPAPDAPTSSPAATDDPIKQYFGDNAQIKSTAQENGQDYYVIEYSFPVNCNEAIYLYRATDADSATYTNNVVYVSWVNTQNYVVYKSFSYLDTVNETNLIDSSVQTGESKTTDFASVAGNFNFDYNVPVRILDVSLLSTTPEEDAKNTADYIATLNADVLLINHPTLKVTSIYAYDPTPVVAEGWDYFSDRSYYPAGARGDKMFQDATAKTEFTTQSINSLVSVSASEAETFRYFGAEAYANSYSNDQILKNRYNDYTVSNQQNLTWAVDGQPVSATLYTIEVKSWMMPLATDDSARSSIMPVEPGYACEGEDCTYTEKVAMLSYGNTKFLVNLSPELDVNNLNFDAYQTQNTADMQFLRTEISRLRTESATLEGRGEASKPIY